MRPHVCIKVEELELKDVVSVREKTHSLYGQGGDSEEQTGCVCRTHELRMNKTIRQRVHLEQEINGENANTLSP